VRGSYIKKLHFGDLVVGTGGVALTGHDGDLRLRRESRVKSGDYLLTVATELENLAAYTDDKVIQDVLQYIIAEFEYVDQHYKLTSKSRSKLPRVSKQSDD
jgi:hypothetical protein